uniref:Regulator of G protein signaling 22 n=1 Tax=Athene cunicularia TaxID=194338 RepID=A0A663N3K1_ATHCN
RNNMIPGPEHKLHQTFAQPVKFNSDFGVFEVVNDASQRLEGRLKKILHDQKPPNPIYDVLRKAKNDGQLSKVRSASPTFNIDPNYNTMCLDREQAIQWIKKERLPAFLESDCYFEYRLAKLISQLEWSKTGINFIIDSEYYPWIRKQDPISSPSEEDDTLLIMKKLHVSLGQATVSQTKDWFMLAKQSESMKTTDSFMHPVASTDFLSKERDQRRFLSPSRTASAKADIIRERSIEAEEDSSIATAELPSHAQLRVYLDPKWDSASKEENRQESTTFQTPEEFIPVYTQLVMKEPVSELIHHPGADTESDVDFHKQPEVFTNELANDKFACGIAESLFSQSYSPFTVLDSRRDVKERDTEELSLRSSSESDGADSRAASCISHRTYDTGSRHKFERFKKFIKGTVGERYWWLWMDIERLKALKDTTRQQRQLSKMKKLYLLSSGDYFLSSEVLLRLDLLHGDQWNIRHLRWIQPEVVKPLLLYWGPRFCVTHSTAMETASAKLKLWHTCQERPRMDIDPFPQIVSLLPLTPKSCMPRVPSSPPQGDLPTLLQKSCFLLPFSIPVTVWKEAGCQPPYSSAPNSTTRDASYSLLYDYILFVQGKSAAGSVVFGGSRMESMLQSLYLENRSGYYFTQFCEKSGNKLWKNSAYFWFDLQAYHQLFYQGTLHPFKICKQAQFLYATYIAPSASMDIGLHQSKKNMIYQKIDPAFEDLFDPAEEYILTVLLEPWMKMVEADKYTYGKVELVEETRQLDSVYFRKLQALHQESGSKKDEVRQVPTNKNKLFLSERVNTLSIKDQHLCQVPKELTGLNLSDLIHDKKNLEQFWAFLNEHSAGMDLLCWLDIEQFRKMVHKDKEKREEKSKDIKKKYLNKNYFFGPNSPATREQQEELIHSGGGWGQMLHDRLSAVVLLEIQQCVQKRLEKQWLPLFLADEHHGAKGQAKVIFEQQQHIQHVDNKWVSSSSEIIAFRKALLNPVTANQFQRFVSLKGDLLENGVLFWQEVQKYKDLCHSHCDDATVQKKITAIIKRFINSAVPPALQIDIPTEQAKTILEHRKELGPYIFREAQMTIFALLFKFWPKFCKFRSNLDSDKILLALERKKGKKTRKKKGKTAEVRLTKFQVAADELHKLLHEQTNMNSNIPFSASWSYSKYIEALEQERILLKMQEDLEKTSTSFLTGCYPSSKHSNLSKKQKVSTRLPTSVL